MTRLDRPCGQGNSRAGISWNQMESDGKEWFCLITVASLPLPILIVALKMFSGPACWSVLAGFTAWAPLHSKKYLAIVAFFVGALAQPVRATES